MVHCSRLVSSIDVLWCCKICDITIGCKKGEWEICTYAGFRWGKCKW
jgi:hypothetical protein